MKKNRTIFILLLTAMVSSAVGIHALLNYRQNQSLLARNRLVWQQLKAADETVDPETALARYRAIRPADETVQMRILNRQWAIVLNRIQGIQRVKRNAVLEETVPVLYSELSDQLQETHKAATSLIGDFPDLPDEVTWRIHNLKAAVNLIRAFVVMETEKNLKKTRGTLKEAISDLKTAIDRVDRSREAATYKNAPRWNLELLQGRQNVEKILMSRTDTQSRLDLKENLEAIIPEKGGYAPGDPLEIRVKQ